MEKYVLLFVLSLGILTASYCQVVEYVQKVEYATVYLKVYYQTKLIKYDR
ncbi:MAG: hypothetical protein R6U15_04895 [Candidatus Izemoplasmatales bacterium]